MVSGAIGASALVAALVLAAVPACSSLHGSPLERGMGWNVAFVPSGQRVAPGVHGLRRPGLCELQPVVRQQTMGARVGAKIWGSSSAARSGRTCAGAVGGGFMEDPDAWGDDELWEQSGEKEGADWRTVLLKDSKLDRTIECFVDREIEVEGKQYATLMPADTPVIMAGYKMVNGSQQLVPVLDDKTIDDLFPTAFAVLSEMDLTLTRSAVVLTVEETDGGDISLSDSDEDDDDEDGDEFMVLGLGPDGSASITFSFDEDDSDDSDDYDDEDVLSLGSGPNGPIGLRRSELLDVEAGEVDGPPRLEESEDEDDEEEADESEKVQVLATFYYNGDKYVVATPLEPVLIIGSPVAKGAELRSELKVSSDLDMVGKLPGSAELANELQDAEESNKADYLLPDREELERVTPKIEETLETMWDVEEKERKVLVRLRQQLINQWGRTE